MSPHWWSQAITYRLSMFLRLLSRWAMKIVRIVVVFKTIVHSLENTLDGYQDRTWLRAHQNRTDHHKVVCRFVLIRIFLFLITFFPSTIEWYETIFGVFVVTKFWFFGRVEAEDSQGMGATSQLTVTYRLEIDGCQTKIVIVWLQFSRFFDTWLASGVHQWWSQFAYNMISCSKCYLL